MSVFPTLASIQAYRERREDEKERLAQLESVVTALAESNARLSASLAEAVEWKLDAEAKIQELQRQVARQAEIISRRSGG